LSNPVAGKNSENTINFLISGPILRYNSYFSQLNEANNIYLSQISLKLIFTPLIGGHDPKWGNSVKKVCPLFPVISL